MRVDAHHHLWRYTDEEFGWIEDRAGSLRRDFLPADLEQVMAQAQVDLAVAVQARCSLSETAWLLECAAQSSAIGAVVGWLPLTSTDLAGHLDVFAEDSKLVGVREIVQDQPPGFLLQPAFEHGIRQLTERNLTYDILIRAGQLEEAIRFVDRHPNQAFVLDHAAKPSIAKQIRQPWRSQIAELARRPHVMCKLSGLVTESDWHQWTEDDLRPYLDTCLESFGPARCMAGSDWPVCLVATAYTGWWQVLERWAAPLAEGERRQVFGETAAAFYGLQRLLPTTIPEEKR